jgi:hypothetical protein
MPEPVCPDDIFILQNRFCIGEISKNLKGKLAVTSKRIQKCESPACETLVTTHELTVKMTAQRPCDSAMSRPLSGVLKVSRLASAFKKNGKGRGLHAGRFIWEGTGVTISGTLTGVTNAGTHRLPVFKECQVCNEVGVMEGTLCGTVVKTDDPKLKKCKVTAAYRIRFDPTESGGEGAVVGSLEGVILCPCKA